MYPKPLSYVEEQNLNHYTPQTKIRYEKLKAFNNKIEASDVTEGKIKAPKHDCPAFILKAQQRAMGEYLHLLEVRAVIEGIDLSPVTQGDTESKVGLCNG